MSNLILIDRKNKKRVVCETRRGGAEVQLPPAGTGLDLTFATGTQAEELLMGNSPAPGGACGTGQKNTALELDGRAVLFKEQVSGFDSRQGHPSRRETPGKRERQVRDGNASRFHVCNGLARRPGLNKKSALPPQAATMEAKGHGQPSRIRHDTARNGFNSRLRHSGTLPGL